MQSKIQLIKEMIEDALLAESRAKDLKKKYPALAEFGVIDELSKIDPSGNNKYLGWLLKHWIAVMQSQFADKGFAAFMAADADQELSPEEETKLVNLEREITTSTQRVLNALEPILRTYHQGLDLAKSLQKSGRINLDGPANDINTFEPGSLELLQFVRELKAEKQRREHEKEQAKAISKQAKQESNVIYEDENVKVIRPNTKLASCYFGKGTKWCISAEMSQNYFDSYTSQGKAFYFMFWSGAPNPNHPFAKVAMVVDTLSPVPEVEEYFDSPDNSMYSDEVIDGVASMWQESGYAAKLVDDVDDPDDLLDVIRNTIDAIEREAVEDAEQNRAGPNIERYDEILEEVNHRDWKYLDIYVEDMGGEGIYIRASLNIDLNEVVKRYMNEKKVFLQWAPGFPDQYSEEWLEGTLFNWILEWYRVNQSADIWDILAEDTAPTDKDDLRLSFNIELEPEVYRDIDRFESLAADFERDDASLAQNISELIEDEEFFDVYKKDESRDEEEWPLILSKYDEEYFPGGPEFKKDQMELPFNDNGRRPGDVIDQMTKRNQRFSPIDLPDDLREQLEQKVLQKLESKLVAEAFINELPEISKKELLKLAQEADKSPESQQKLVELISRLLGDYFELGDLEENVSVSDYDFQDLNEGMISRLAEIFIKKFGLAAEKSKEAANLVGQLVQAKNKYKLDNQSLQDFIQDVKKDVSEGNVALKKVLPEPVATALAKASLSLMKIFGTKLFSRILKALQLVPVIFAIMISVPQLELFYDLYYLTDYLPFGNEMKDALEYIRGMTRKQMSADNVTKTAVQAAGAALGTTIKRKKDREREREKIAGDLEENVSVSDYDSQEQLEESIFLEALDKYSELSGLGTLLERGPAPNASNDAALAKELLISLPKFVPSESWGKSGSVAREEIRKFVNLLSGGTIQERMSHLMRIQHENSRIRATNRIISSLILLESLRSIILSYNASSAGFVFEGFIAALMNGEQVDAKQGGALPIEDVMAFTYDGQKPGVPYSLKLLKSGADVHGSYKNLIYSLFDAYREQGMGYVVAYKSGDASASDFSISLREYHFNSSNIIDILYKEAHNHELLRYKNKKITQKMIDAMSPEEALELLMNSDGALRGKGKSGWKLSANALEQVEYKDLGTLQLSSSAIQKTAERYIQKLQENITTLFKSVSQLSDHINEYIVSKDRDKAMLNGREAIKDTQKIKKSLENQQKTDK